MAFTSAALSLRSAKQAFTIHSSNFALSASVASRFSHTGMLSMAAATALSISWLLGMNIVVLKLSLRMFQVAVPSTVYRSMSVFLVTFTES